MSTAMVSPSARPSASTTPVAIPLRAAGKAILVAIDHAERPSALPPIRSDAGTLLRLLVATSVTVGRIIRVRTSVAASKLGPGGASAATAGTKTVMPQRPNTTERSEEHTSELQ